MKTSDLDYNLPPELIATEPAEPRDSARMLVVRPGDDVIEHRHVRDLPEYLGENDRLIFNHSKVIPARFMGHRSESGGRIEGLFLDEPAPGQWLCMLRSNGKLREGAHIELIDERGDASGFNLSLIEKCAECWLVDVRESPATSVLERIGRTPLPPYILKARGDRDVPDAFDRQRYQTVYADDHEAHSVAAPTAGLHFTPELVERLRSRGVRDAHVVLHVGAGTFKPIEVDNVLEHAMHEERFHVPAETLRLLDETGRGGDVQRVIAVGTTTVRTLESLPSRLPEDALERGYYDSTKLLIAPPHEFQRVHGMLTNFHLPRSTLLALVAAMTDIDRLRAIYEEAVVRRYRFYSYGDAMLILP